MARRWLAEMFFDLLFVMEAREGGYLDQKVVQVGNEGGQKVVWMLAGWLGGWRIQRLSRGLRRHVSIASALPISW